MEFTMGSVVFLSSMLLLAILARISAHNPASPVLRGEFLPAMLAVLIATGLTMGLLMMVLGGEAYFPSRSIKLAVIVVFTVVSIWVVARLVGRSSHGGLPA
jgi:hypothetical protein